MTLLYQIQRLLERTYAPIGLNLEECLIGRKRYAELSVLAGPLVNQLSNEGRTFLRIVDGQLYLAVYYHPLIISTLEEHHPLKVVSESNIHSLIVFFEELAHAVHAALLFLENRLPLGSKSLVYDFELQAKVDTYLGIELLISILRKRRHPTKKQLFWLKKILFGNESFAYQDGELRSCYLIANQFGLRLVQYLDTLETKECINFVRKFRRLSFLQKCRLIEAISV